MGSLRLFGLTVGSLVLGGCLPGPWEYVPESRPLFRGITVSGYALADRPVEHLCFERLLELSEASSEAFPFYDSAAVGVSGVFSSGGQTLALTPHANTPNCFVGPPGSHFRRGERYDLNARFVWDSAGARTVTVLQSTAEIPALFEIADTARAPSLAAQGVALDNITDPDVFLRLPPGPRALFVARYGDTLTALDGDSAGLAAWEARNGARMRAELTLWLQADLFPYRRGDSLYYLNAKNNFSNLSHFFKARRDNLVKGVLISHLFDTTASRPVTSFDSIFGIAPDSSSFYTPGGSRRLIFYGDYRNPDGRHIFDSLGFVNAWFWSGRNRLYFYGTEKIYSDYQTAREEQAGNSKINLPTNVTGGRGFFAGMIVDSFDINIRLDSLTQSFPYPLTRAAACRDKGWDNTRDCIGYYGEYCALNGWTPSDCRVNAMYRLLDPLDSLTLPTAIRDSARAWRAADPLAGLGATQRYCIDNNYPAGVPGCAFVKSECESGNLGNGCQLLLWKRCQLAYWKLPACAEGINSYCRARRDVHTVMCRDVPE
jgi:hypothetical protein